MIPQKTDFVKVDTDLIYLAAFIHFPKFRSKHLKKIQNTFGLWQTAWQAGFTDLLSAGISEKLVGEFLSLKRSLNPEEIWQKLKNENINLLCFKDTEFPALLAQIYDPPLALFYRGTLPAADIMSIGIVGTRQMSQYGKQVVGNIAEGLAANGINIVSGLALGIDGEAHSAAMRANGKTVAVLGSGVDRQSIYPSQHRYLANKIIDSGGAIVSEYAPGVIPLQHHFPERNRIIAGWSKGVLVVEAKEKSGALITAQFALDGGRDVFAVPGPVTSETSFGPNQLIKSGAALVTCAEDILHLLNISPEPISPAVKPEGLEVDIWRQLSQEPQHIDELSECLNIDIPALSSILSLMEIKGLVKNAGMMHFIRG